VLQVLASLLPVYPFRLALVLVPIVIGAALIGRAAGAWLGFVFGFVVLVTSPDVIAFMTFSAPATILVVLLRGVLAGLAAAVVYKLLAKKSKTAGVITAAVICPIVNTGIFVLGMYVFFLPLISEWAGGAASVTSFIFLGMIGVNFIFELAINLVFSSVIVRLIQYGQDKRRRA